MADRVKEPAPGPDLRAERVARTEDQLIEAAQRTLPRAGLRRHDDGTDRAAGRPGQPHRLRPVRHQASVFRRVIDRAIAGDAEPIDVAHQARTREALTASTLAERIDALADVCVGVAQRAGRCSRWPPRPRASNRTWPRPQQPDAAPPPSSAKRSGPKPPQTASSPTGSDPALLALVTDVLVCADTTVHLRRTDSWSASTHRRLVVDTLTTLAALHAP